MGIPYIVIAGLYGKYSVRSLMQKIENMLTPAQSDWPAHPVGGWACVAMAYIYVRVWHITPV